MKQYHNPAKKKVSRGTGARRVKYKDKKLCHIGGVFTSTRVSETERRDSRRTRGGNKASKLKKAVTMNVVTKSGIKKAKILRVLESHNPEYVRMNIITKGTVLETDLGKVKVTNRVGQDGIINGVLLS
ncbi:MAG: 30S ribosomal protein S8e [Candidatus Micrarchaeota archaeon]